MQQPCNHRAEAGSAGAPVQPHVHRPRVAGEVVRAVHAACVGLHGGGGGVPAVGKVARIHEPAPARAQLALDRFDESKRIGQLLEQTGYGNNPDVLRFFNRLADALMEDGLVQGQAGGSMPPLEERMYAGWSSRNGNI